MSLEFHQTPTGRKFLEDTMPRLALGIDRIASTLEKLDTIAAQQVEIAQLREDATALRAELREVKIERDTAAKELRDLQARYDEVSHQREAFAGLKRST